MDNTVYLVFDQLPTKQSGGGTAKTYADFINEFEDDLDIKIVSIFGYQSTDYEEFNRHQIIEITRNNIDTRFVDAFSYIKNRQFKQFFFAIYSAILFFLFIPIARSRTKRLLSNKNVIVSAPAAAIFISKKVDYILEIHVSFEYFWGDNVLGRLQSLLITKPKLTIFRSRSDQTKASCIMNADYIYNGYKKPDNLLESSKDSAVFRKAIYVGSLGDPLKNPGMLIDCAEIVKNEINDFTLDIYGEGALKKDLEKMIVERNLTDTVFLRGYMHDKTTYKHYGMLWMTSIYEGLPLVIIEAKSFGLPTVTTVWGDAVYEVIDDGRNGLIAEDTETFASKVIDLIQDEEKMKRFSSASYQDYFNRFSEKKHKQRWKEVIQEQFQIFF